MSFRRFVFTLALGSALPLLAAATAQAQVSPPVTAQSAERAAGSSPPATPASTPSGPARDTWTETPASADSDDGRWQLSAYGSWLPGIGEAKRGALDGGPPGSAPGYGIRIEKSLHDWWSAGLMLSSRSWEIDAPQAATGLLSNGSFLDAALMVKFEPLSVSVGGGPLSVYLAAAGGPTLAGSKRSYAAAGGAAPSESLELLSFEAGYNTSAWLGASWMPTGHWGLFVEGGLDWHFAVHSRNTVDFAQPGTAADPPSAIAEKLWLAQGMLNLGALYRF